MELQTEFGPVKIDWDAADYKTAEGAANGLYRALQKTAVSFGYSADEVWIKTPEESIAHGYVDGWHVCWESGPFDWGCSVFASGVWGHVETYWGFDLAFYK